jgi:hypothetical protein
LAGCGSLTAGLKARGDALQVLAQIVKLGFVSTDRFLEIVVVDELLLGID